MMTLSEYVKVNVLPTEAAAKDITPASGYENGIADVMFFRVMTRLTKASAVDFLDRVRAEFPHWLDGKEHSYLEIGGDIGDQGLALCTMGLGHLLGVWELLTPRYIFGDAISDADAMKMAGLGYISIIQPHSERAHEIAAAVAYGLGVKQ